VAPSLVWGIGIGLVIAAIDTVSIVLIRSAGASEWPIADIDDLANIMLYAFVGFRVGMMTGVVRDAAEAGVIAGVVVGVVALAVQWFMPLPTGAIESVNQVIGVLALNVALGGVLAIVTGWFGSQSSRRGPSSSRR
jgi:hypothetical protein